MSTLQMLDVAIGIFLIFLLLSLICSACNEVVEAILKKRPSDLHDGIKELLEGSNADAGSYNILDKFYKHPLINSLFRGKYNGKSTRNPPSYIPSKNFALALLDIILPATSDKLSGATGGSRDAAAVKEISPRATDDTASAGKAKVPGAVPTTGDSNSQMPAADPAQDPLATLRTVVINMPASNARQALLTLIDASGNNMNRVRESIEMWYNSSMDRVSGWYKRRVQWILLLLGLLAAVALNADTIAIFKSLMKDAPLRNSLVSATAEYAKASGKDSAFSPQDRVERHIQQLNDLRLPIGWDWNTRAMASDSTQQNNTAQSQQHVNNAALAIPPAAFWPWFYKVLGWMLTALAVSQGAPFWFDLLNKFMVIRSTVKPHEKSPEEASEDRQKR